MNNMKHIITIIAVLLLSANSFAQNSSLEKDQARLDSLLKPLTDQRKSLISALNKTNNPDSIEKMINLCCKKREETKFKFARENPNSELSPGLLSSTILNDVMTGYLPLDTLKAYYNKLTNNARGCENGMSLGSCINMIENVSKGKMAPIFSTIDYNNKTFNLSDLRGHYVILDFWASWCIFCRRNIPKLKELYAKYKECENGLKLVFVSVDDKHDEWSKAIAEDGIKDNINVLDIMSFKDKTGKEYAKDFIRRLYYVQPIPTSFLIDPNGVIVGRMTYNEIEKALKNIYTPSKTPSVK